jgi:hypothetical protein
MDTNQIPGFNPLIHVPTFFVSETGQVIGGEATPLGEGQLSIVDILGESPHQAANEAQWVTVRAERDKRLLESDWSDTASAQSRLSSELLAQWATYRQALRDITKQNNPFLIVWPDKPAATATTPKPIVYAPSGT